VKQITRARVQLPKIVDAYVEPLTPQAELTAIKAKRGDPIPGRAWKGLINFHSTDLYLVVEIEPATKKKTKEEVRRFRKRRVHAFARSHRKNRRHFIIMQGKKFWLDWGYFTFLRAMARQDTKLLTYDQAS